MMRVPAVLIVTLALIAAIVAAPQASSAQTPTAPSAPGASPAPGSTPVVPAPFTAPDEDINPDDPAEDELRSGEEHNPPFGGPGMGAGGRNIVMIRNHSDGRMRVRGRIRLVQIDGPSAAPVNGAYVLASCTDCQSFGVALEIVLLSPNTTQVMPQNRAIAKNVECNRCVTVARALQYVFTVDDPNDVPPNVRGLLNDMEKEIREIGRESNITAIDANARINVVIDRFRELAISLSDQAEQTEDATSPDATPMPSASPTTTSAPTSDASPVPDTTFTPTPTLMLPDQVTPTPTLTPTA